MAAKHMRGGAADGTEGRTGKPDVDGTEGRTGKPGTDATGRCAPSDEPSTTTGAPDASVRAPGAPTYSRRAAIAVGVGALAGIAAVAGGIALLGRSPDAAPTAPVTGPTSESASAPVAAATTSTASPTTPAGPSAADLLARLDIAEVYHADLAHGPKGVEFQRYIVLHDTEGDGRPEDIVSWWESNGNLVAAHFTVGKDGHMALCVPIDQIAHHAGYGDTGHNELFGVTDESRDDKLGTTPIGSDFADYGMNSYSIGIELVHVGGEGDYPAAQLDALDNLVAYLDAYWAERGQTTLSTIIDHKMWRTGNSDTSPEFAGYLANYRDHRTHADA